VEPSSRGADLRHNTMAVLYLLPNSGPPSGFVGVRQRRVLGPWEHARMASTSSIRRAGSKGSAITTGPGAVATWWREQRGDLAKDAIIGFVIGVVLFLGACWWDARLQARQDALASAIADRQDDLARDLANQAEVLENTRFVRQVATTKGNTPKPFASINLGGAQLGGLNLGCTDQRQLLGCADFLKADLHEANLTYTNLSGAGLMEADLQKANLDYAGFDGAQLDEANLAGVATKTRPSRATRPTRASFRGAGLLRATLFQARLPESDFRHALFYDANADEAVLSSANFHHATLRLSRFKRADLRHANFRGANMTRVDLTSADLRGADFTHADLRKAVLTDVCFDNTTKWGTNSPPASSSC
jgi:uncharacterized protein YjbI with pentapeptide repeats